MLQSLIKLLWVGPRTMLGGGGGSGSNVSKWEPLAELRDYHPEAISAAAQLAAKPYTPYPYQRVADINPIQQQGLQTVMDLAVTGTPSTNAAQNVTLNTLTGGYANPYANMATEIAGNPYMPMDNPYLRGAIQSGQQDLANAYGRGTAAQTDAMAALSHTYGGSAHQDRITQNQDQLAKALSSVEMQYGLPAYQQAGQLAESAINRGTQAQQTDIARAAQGWEAERARQMSAIPQAWQNYGQQMGAGQALTSVGDVYQNQTQNLLNQAYQDWSGAQQYPQQQLENFLSALVRGSGGFGTNTATNVTQQAWSPASSLLGAGLMGYGLLNPGK